MLFSESGVFVLDMKEWSLVEGILHISNSPALLLLAGH